MSPQLSFSNLDKLQEIKLEIKSLLIAAGQKNVTLNKLSILYKNEIGECIPFKDFNFTSLKEFLLSIPDTVKLYFDQKTNSMYVYPIESEKTRHLTSLIARQKVNKNSKKSRHKPKLHSNLVDPTILTKVMSKLSSCSVNKGYFKKADLLSELQSTINAYSSYTMKDLNHQLNELSHILIHDEENICMKTENRTYEENELEGLIKQITKDRLWQLIQKYPEGIWCAQLPDVYRNEYGVDLEYQDLGFNSIIEFIAILPNIFRFIQPPYSLNYKVVSAEMSMDRLKILTTTDIVENVTDSMMKDTLHALPKQSSSEVSKRLIPKEFMNFDDTVEQINIENVVDDSDVIISEIYNPSYFWIILRKNKRSLIKLMDSLQGFYTQQDLDKYKIPPIILKPGLHVACIYSKRWHRGIIKTMQSDSLRVLFYDYGTTKVYKADELYFLHKRYAIVPAQAIPSGLHNVKPMENWQWSQMAIEKFVDRTIERDFVASIFNKDEENNSLMIDLIDTTNTVDVYMSEWMVSNNLAIFGNYVTEKDNFLIRHRKEYLKKYQSKLVKNVQNVGRFDVNEELEQYSNYVKPAQKLEALKKYKTRFKLLEISFTDPSQNANVEKSNQANCNVPLEILAKDKTENCEHLDVKNERKENVGNICFKSCNVDKPLEFKGDSMSIDRPTISNGKNDVNNTQNSRVQKVIKKNIGDALKELEKLILSTKL